MLTPEQIADLDTIEELAYNEATKFVAKYPFVYRVPNYQVRTYPCADSYDGIYGDSLIAEVAASWHGCSTGWFSRDEARDLERKIADIGISEFEIQDCFIGLTNADDAVAFRLWAAK
uniref:hypothetical protein n=1 Tax=Methylobacterium sp. B34 TaxID=95563 RepID=UPI000FE14108|nr:hypothetical protein [Methylobacterium sp. B34]